MSIQNLVIRAAFLARGRKMRMKFNKSGQLLLVSAASLAVAGLLSACSTLTVDFVYVTSALAAGTNSYGQVDVFEVNSESGHMRQIPTSPFPSGGRKPVAEATSVDHNNLYVVNEDDNSIVQFIIGNDGKLYPQNTVNTPGVFPMAVAVTASTLYVADTYQPLPTCSTAAPCSGSIAVYPILAKSGSVVDGTLKPNLPINSCNGLDYVPLGLTGSTASDIIVPSAINISANGSTLFVTAYDSSNPKTVGGLLFAFTTGTTQCTPSGSSTAITIPTLTAVAGSPFSAGVTPSGIASDPTSSYVYVTDSSSGDVLGFTFASGTVTPMSPASFVAGNGPSSIVIDASGKYAYVANSQDSNVTAYSISSGALNRIGTSYATGTQPVAIGIDPSRNQYLYTVNFLGSNVSGFEVNATDGSLLNAVDSPFAANAQPTAIAAIPHGTSSKSK
jgi:6-phosphogluconolactonase (cycloisomerase 2 family)